MEQSGRGEALPSSTYQQKSSKSNRSYKYSSSYCSPFSTDLNTNYMNTNMLKRIPRSTNTSPSYQWPATLAEKRTATQRSYLSRAHTEVRDIHQTSSNYSSLVAIEQ